MWFELPCTGVLVKNSYGLFFHTKTEIKSSNKQSLLSWFEQCARRILATKRPFSTPQQVQIVFILHYLIHEQNMFFIIAVQKIQKGQ